MTSSATGLGLTSSRASSSGASRRNAEAAPDAAVGALEIEPPEELAEHRVFRPAAQRAYEVAKVADGAYRVTGKGIERLVARYDLDNEDALAYLERRLRGIGVIRRARGRRIRAGRRGRDRRGRVRPRSGVTGAHCGARI